MPSSLTCARCRLRSEITARPLFRSRRRAASSEGFADARARDRVGCFPWLRAVCSLQLSPSPYIGCDGIIDVSGRKIVSDYASAGSLRLRLLHAALEKLRQRKSKTLTFLKRARFALECLPVERRGGGGDRDH